VCEFKPYGGEIPRVPAALYRPQRAAGQPCAGRRFVESVLGGVAMTKKHPDKTLHKETILTSHGRRPQEYEGAVNIPTVRTSTVVFPDFATYQAAFQGRLPYALYGRYGTATRHGLQDTIAALEEADLTLLYPSGLAATNFALAA